MVAATSTLDPIRPSVLMLTAEEIEDAKAQIAAGLLPSNYFELCAEARRQNVFGHDYKTDRNGNPLESGIGSPSNPSLNSYRALKRAEEAGLEPVGSYEKAVARCWRDTPEAAKRIGLPASK